MSWVFRTVCKPMTEQVTKGKERASERRTHTRASEDTQPVAQYFLMTLSITTHVPGPLGRGAEETLHSYWRQTKNRARTTSWSSKVVEILPQVGRPVPSGVSTGKPCTSPLVMDGPSTHYHTSVGIHCSRRHGPVWVGTGAAFLFLRLEDQMLITPPKRLWEGNGAPRSTGGSVSVLTLVLPLVGVYHLEQDLLG